MIVSGVSRLLRLVVILAVATAVLAGSITGVSYAAGQIFHGAATAKAEPMYSISANADVPSTIYAADGTVLATLRSSQNRQPVALSQISPTLISAVLDTEDEAFWIHGGFDVKSALRALTADAAAGSSVQGGSTITQQLVKNTYLTPQKSLNRKLREAVLSERLQQKYTKAQILDAYLNLVYLGNGAYGVQAAAKEYFNENASQVNVPQAALLAGLIQAPSGYDPIANPLGARTRRSEVLGRMLHYKTITPAQAQAADATPLPTQINDPPGSVDITYGYYEEQVVRQLLAPGSPLGTTSDERYRALYNGGLKIYTNLQPGVQDYAQNVPQRDIPSSLYQGGVTAAFAIIDPTNGNVEAVVGGKGSGTNGFDDATQAERQPGSGFKLFTLVAALEAGYNVNDSILGTSPCALQFPGIPLQYGYNVQNPLHNDPGDPNGPVTIVQATADSINCAYLRLAHEDTLTKVVDVARSMGVSMSPGDPPLNPNNESLVLGTEDVSPIEMAAAYATVADGGIYHPPTFINHIVDRTGTTIYNGEAAGKRIFSTQIAAEAIEALRATVQYGTGTAAALPNQEVAGKTGTTSNAWDAWFNGITPTLVTSVWMGYQQGDKTMYVNGNALSGNEVFGADYPTQIWHDVMKYALQSTPYTVFPSVNSYSLPPVKFIDSTQLQKDDLLAHGGYYGPCPTDSLGRCVTPTTFTPTPTRAPTRTAPASGGPSTTSTPIPTQTAPATSTAPVTTAPPSTSPASVPSPPSPAPGAHGPAPQSGA
jgi:membrane peptidoglycan carboxypeptidase